MPTKTITATDEHITAIRSGAYAAAAREMAQHGVRLTHEQADEIGDVGIDWLRTRLYLRIETDDSGVSAWPDIEAPSDGDAEDRATQWER